MQHKFNSEHLTQETYRAALTFLRDREAMNVSPKTLKGYADELRYFLNYLDQNQVVQMAGVTADVVRGYILALALHRNPGGCHVAYRLVKAFLHFWQDETEGEYLSPMKKVRPPKVNTQPKPGIPLEDIKKILAVCNTYNGKRDKAIFSVLLDTGLRAQELLDLNVGNVNLEDGSVRVNHGKGDKARTVYLESVARRTLRAYLKTRENLAPTSPLFLNLYGSRLEYLGLRMVVKRRAEQAGVPVPGVHDFRRAFAITMLRRGASIAVIARILGHAGLEVVRRYLYLIDDDVANDHRKFSPGNLLG